MFPFKRVIWTLHCSYNVIVASITLDSSTSYSTSWFFLVCVQTCFFFLDHCISNGLSKTKTTHAQQKGLVWHPAEARHPLEQGPWSSQSKITLNDHTLWPIGDFYMWSRSIAVLPTPWFPVVIWEERKFRPCSSADVRKHVESPKSENIFYSDALFNSVSLWSI